MTEEDARERVRAIAGTKAYAAIERYVDLLATESVRQNMVALSTLPSVWERHILDSAQLAAFARDSDDHWIDVGSGGGLPGVVLACLGRWRMTMVEPRRGRVRFLEDCVDTLGLARTSVIRANAQAAEAPIADIVSARAVGSIDNLLRMTGKFSSPTTRFVLPRGVGAQDDLADAQRNWRGLFHVEHSVTQKGAGIVIVEEVKPR